MGRLNYIVREATKGQRKNKPKLKSGDNMKRGMALIKHCREILRQAEERIEKISKEKETVPKASLRERQESEERKKR